MRFGMLTRVRIDPGRVRVDAPDVIPAMAILIASGLALAPIEWAIARWLGWAGLAPAVAAPALLAAAAAGSRLHLRVTAGRALLLRTVLGIPWSLAIRRSREGTWIVGTFEETALHFPDRRGVPDHGPRLVAVPLDREGGALVELDAAIARLLE